MIYHINSDIFYSFLSRAQKEEEKWNNKHLPKTVPKMSYIDLINSNTT